MMKNQLVTIAVAAQLMGISKRSLYNYCATGAFPSVRIGRRVLVRRADLEALFDDAVGTPDIHPAEAAG
jgi:excisionase family DNA binding protein